MSLPRPPPESEPVAGFRSLLELSREKKEGPLGSLSVEENALRPFSVDFLLLASKTHLPYLLGNYTGIPNRASDSSLWDMAFMISTHFFFHLPLKYKRQALLPRWQTALLLSACTQTSSKSFTKDPKRYYLEACYKLP